SGNRRRNSIQPGRRIVVRQGQGRPSCAFLQPRLDASGVRAVLALAHGESTSMRVEVATACAGLRTCCGSADSVGSPTFWAEPVSEDEGKAAPGPPASSLPGATAGSDVSAACSMIILRTPIANKRAMLVGARICVL